MNKVMSKACWSLITKAKSSAIFGSIILVSEVVTTLCCCLFFLDIRIQ